MQINQEIDKKKRKTGKRRVDDSGRPEQLSNPAIP